MTRVLLGNRPLVLWAARDLGRHPLYALLLFASLMLLVTLVTLVLLLGQSVSSACRRWSEQAPDLVVRRVLTGGWAPLPVSEALESVGKVAGTLRPRPRVWGVVRGPEGPLTVVGVDAAGPDWPADLPPPRPGEALLGTAGRRWETMRALPLEGLNAMSLKVVGRLPATATSVLHDGVVLHVRDARTLLGLTADQATDLALDVFHDAEAEALRSDLAHALPWPATITTGREQLRRQLDDINRRTGWLLASFAPALAAMALIVAAVGAAGRRRRWETALLKALGWSGGDLLRWQIYRGLLIGGPALTLGSGTAYLMLFAPGVTWIARWIFGLSGAAPALQLSAQGVAGMMLLALILVGLPFMASIFWSGWRNVTQDPAECLAEEG